MGRTLIITNDFPPKAGGIQSFVHALALRRPPGSVVVYCSDPAARIAGAPGPGAVHRSAVEAFDLAQPFPIVREAAPVLLPTPGAARRAARIAALEGCDTALFGAAAPLGLMAPALRRAGVRRAVGLTHGHEAGWAALPGPRAALRRIGESVDVLTYLGDYTRRRIAGALSAGAAARMRRLAPGVDSQRFHPGADGAAVRKRYGLEGAPVAVCVSRLVRRKGQDMLIRGWPRVRADVPGARLLLVGGGPDRARLERLARDRGVAGSVVFAGDVAAGELPAHYAAGDVFAMPCRTRGGGLDAEGLGMVFLEASATGLPVVAGDSGGAPDAVLDGRTGTVADGTRPGPPARAVAALLADPARAAALGAAGRAWTRAEWDWDRVSGDLAALLDG